MDDDDDVVVAVGVIPASALRRFVTTGLSTVATTGVSNKSPIVLDVPPATVERASASVLSVVATVAGIAVEPAILLRRQAENAPAFAVLAELVTHCWSAAAVEDPHATIAVNASSMFVSSVEAEIAPVPMSVKDNVSNKLV